MKAELRRLLLLLWACCDSRAASFASLLVLLFPIPAEACRGYPYERSIFFSEPITYDHGQPFVARVSILQTENNSGLARINEVMSGIAPTKEIQIQAPPLTSCGPIVRVGEEGVVVGIFKDGVLKLLTESGEEKERKNQLNRRP